MQFGPMIWIDLKVNVADPETETEHGGTGEDDDRRRLEAAGTQESDLDQGNRSADGDHSAVGDWLHS